MWPPPRAVLARAIAARPATAGHRVYREAPLSARGRILAAREAALAKLAAARRTLRDLRDREAIEWQRGYIKAFEEMLAVEGLSVRRSLRRGTDIPVEIAPRSAAQRGNGTITELGATGCRLTTPLALTDGDLLELSLRLHGLVVPITFDAVVLRATRAGEHTTGALEFRELTLAAADALAAFLARPSSRPPTP